MTASEALLADIADINRIQAEKGLPLVNGDMSYKKNKEVGKILKPPGKGSKSGEPFFQEETVEHKNVELPKEFVDQMQNKQGGQGKDGASNNGMDKVTKSQHGNKV